MEVSVTLSWLPAFLPAHSFHVHGLSASGFSSLNVPEATDRIVLAGLIAIGVLLSRIIANTRVPRCLARQLDILLALKALVGSLYIGAAVTILASTGREWVLPGVAVAAAITFFGASISEHYHSIAPSTFTTLYAIFGAALYGYTARELDMQAQPVFFYANSTVAVCLSVLIILESTSKQRLLISTDPPPAYESTLSFLVKPFFPHLIPLLVIGSKRRIRLPELRDIPLQLRADPATETLLAALARGDTKSKRYLFKSTFSAFGTQFLGPVIPRLLVITGTFAQVTLVEQMILFVSDQSLPTVRGSFLIATYFFVYVSLTVADYVYGETLNAFMVLYGSALTGSIYSKTLRLTSMAARAVGQGAATTYMSVDVEKVTTGFQTFQDLWAAGVTVLVACVMLWFKAGYVVLAPLLYIITLISATSTVGTFVGPAQKAWLAAIDIRIKLLASVLGQLLPVKLGAYEPALERRINALRQHETRALRRFLLLVCTAGTISNMGANGSFLVTLTAYVAMRAKGWGALPPLDASRIFTLYTIVNILNSPLNMIGQRLPQLFASLASLERIQSFLKLPEKAEHAHEPDVEPALVDVSDAGSNSSSVDVSLIGCTFGWDDKTQVLNDITLELAPRELHMVVGSVASGKSSLLMSILGETRLVEGVMNVNARKIALASQTPFIFPATLRDNILLDSAFDAPFYEQVVDACGLRQDIDALPHRDLGKLGDRGTTLSGGQRQRLAVARAVYAQADLVLLDDVFSALDGETEAHGQRCAVVQAR